ncbi:MAG: hypothetical protein SH847_06505 [Roseiflexaceae bacterium]|nr:hypothetical protein [Roseiflexaceae bacterium]
MNHPDQPTRPPARYLWVLLAYTALTLLMLAPLLPHFGNSVAGGPVARNDAWQNIWNIWWIQHALTTFQNPFQTPLLYYPEGADLHLQTLNISNGILAAPITWLFGPIAGFNSMVVLAFALAGLGGYALALRVSGNPLAAFVGGLALTFSPFHMTKLWDGQLEMIALQWLPLYVLFLVRAVEDLRRRDALLAGVFLALIGYTSWYYFLFFAIFSALFAIIWLAFPPQPPPQVRMRYSASLRMLVQLILAGTTGVLLILPILLPALRNVSGGEGDVADMFGYLKIIHSADLGDFWLPSGLHPLWGQAVTRYAEQIHPYIAAWNISLGYITVALALAAFVFSRRLAWRWALIACVGIVLALGPLLQIGGLQTNIPLPYALLALVPGVAIANRPSHFVVITVVLLAPLVALGMGALLERLPSKRRVFASLIVGGLLIIEFAPPNWPIFQSQPDRYYRLIANSGGAVIDLPPRSESSIPLVAQMVHGLPIMGGYVSRTPGYPFGETAPIVRDLWAMAEGEHVLIPSGPDDELAVLNGYGLRHVIIHWQTLTVAQRQQLQQVLAIALPGVAPSYEDEELTAYVVPPTVIRPFAYFRGGWYGEEREGQRRWRWMGERAEVVIINPTSQPIDVRLKLTAQSYAGQKSVELQFRGGKAGHWDVQPGDTTISMRLLVPPGESSLWLNAPVTEEQSRSRRPLSIVMVAAELR